ncbi:hypothetical protein AAVH_19267 [Aphelenchoides avenae]|nr:hypothetical protein AAVH_19267 [Aphelenchus avenae]
MLILCVVVFYACYTLSTVSNVVKSVTGSHDLIPEEVDFVSLVLLVIASSM